MSGTQLHPSVGNRILRMSFWTIQRYLCWVLRGASSTAGNSTLATHSSQFYHQEETEGTVSAPFISFWGRTHSDLLWLTCASYFPLHCWPLGQSLEPWVVAGGSWRTIQGSSNQIIWFKWEAARPADKRNIVHRTREQGRADNQRGVYSSMSLSYKLAVNTFQDQQPAFFQTWVMERDVDVNSSFVICTWFGASNIASLGSTVY